MTPKEIEKLFNHPAELSAKTDGKGNEKVTLRGEVADLGWLVNKVVTGIYAQVDDPDTVRALDDAITMTIHLRATQRVKELQATGMTLDKITKTLFWTGGKLTWQKQKSMQNSWMRMESSGSRSKQMDMRWTFWT